ncbi:MAG: hypothetical protein MUE59_12095 [Thiobacillaceae bacterium]|nr:hypothetical protein [Thiobacillaceae bacterium]
MNNLVGDYNGTTVGTIGNGSDPSILCGAPIAGSPACPTGEIAPGVNHPQPFAATVTDPTGVNIPTTLYPIDSTFGFNVVPFAEAFDKERGDGIWGEGWVGNVVKSGSVIGLAFSDAETDTFVVPAGLGTWCSGLGGAAVKCSTERFVVMEHVLSCHETIPYYYADPNSGDQLIIKNPVTGEDLVNCADKKLDNNLRVLSSTVPEVDGKMTAEAVTTKEGSFDAIDWTLPGLDPDAVLSVMPANESTILTDIAYGDDYSITAKDDGKALYRWGNLIKRPNDIRVFTTMAVPAAWTKTAAGTANGGKGYRITGARLIINHMITNNPNDQIRPEDMENEGAIGRLPGYEVVGNKWVSDRDCYQGNGLFIPTGTVLKNGDFVIPDTVVPVTNWNGNPYAWSEDLEEGFTNGWATTVDREPFEWAYDGDGDGQAEVSFRTPNNAAGTLISGPRWRLTPPKFGQDIPGLEVPNVECAPPPYQKDLIKYEVGAPVKTVINLLDWDSEDERSIDGESPLVWSLGWTSNGWFNEGTVVDKTIPIVNPVLRGVTVNGAPVTKAFDLSIYIKGDRKPTAIYDATLQIEWDDAQTWVAPAP